jgi:DNA polymerase I-like protein with 3'-5' exonuclease and polymerase domains
MRAVSSRLSSRIHNWPKRKHKEVRGAIAAPPGKWIVACDQGQIEFRVAGMCSQDPNIIKYSWTGYDAHAYWAQRMLDEYPPIVDFVVEFVGVDWDEGGFKALRQEAKNGWVFPQLFGSTTETCAARLHLPDDVAKRLGEEYWDEFRVHRKWQRRLLESYEKTGYVETLGGWRRRGAITSNEAINHPIQGTAAEIVIESFNAISERSQLEGNADIHPIFNGHDDLTFLMHDEGMEANIDIVTAEMCKPRFDYVCVPLIVEVSVGARWHQLKEIAKVSSETVYNLRNPYR